jgi:hypothetical protein
MAAFGASQRRTRGAVNAGEKMHRRGSARDRSEFLVIKLLARLSLAGLYLRGSITGFPSPTPPNSPVNMATRLTFSIGVSGWSVLVGGPSDQYGGERN